MAFVTLRNDPAFAALADALVEVSQGRRVFYSPNIGNWGDGLIHTGVMQFLGHFGIDHKLVLRPQLLRLAAFLDPMEIGLRDAVLITPGCGAWCENFAGARNTVAHAGKLFDHVVVLPSTFELGPVALPSSRITYFRRDNGISREGIPDSRFCHDMAFFLDMDIPEPEMRLEKGTFLRSDGEIHAAATDTAYNIDISRAGNHFSDAQALFRILNTYDQIETDRMHVAIAGAMLGRQVTLYPSNYAKIPDLFRSSLAPHFPNVRLADWNEGQAIPRRLN